MRITSFILSILFLGISVLPCTDGMEQEHLEGDIAVEHVTHSHADAEHEHEDHGDHEDGCSPFCSCSCCGIAITMPPIGEEQRKVDHALNDHRSIWIEDISIEVHSDIWHPPARC